MTTIRRLAVRMCALTALTAAAAQAQGVAGLLPEVTEPPTKAATRGANFLHIMIGARGNAMAGAIGSGVSGSTAWFWNPAGAATIESFDLAVGQQKLYGDLGVKQTYVGISFPLLGGAIGLAVNSLNSGDIPLTTEGTPFGDVSLGQFFQWTSSAVSFGYARRLTDRLDIGVNAKYISEGMSQIRTRWIAGDVGTQFRTGLFGVLLGGSLSSVGTAAHMDGTGLERGVSTNDVSLEQTRFKLFTRPVDLPTEFRFSAGDDLLGSAESLFGRHGGKNTLYGEVAVNDAVDTPVQMGVGVEYGYKNMLFLRGGKRFYNDGRRPAGASASYGFSGGLGLRLPVNGKPLRFDYSYTALGDLNNIQIFSLEFGGR